MRQSHWIVPAIALMLALALAAGLYAAPDDDTGPSSPLALTGADSALATADLTFGFELLDAAVAGHGDENVVISPLSISMALAMVANGAAGATHEAMMSTMQLEGMPDDVMNQAVADMMKRLNRPDSSLTISIANSIWVDQDFSVKPSFLDINRQFFHAEVGQLDFGSAASPATINKWVSDHTREKITDIIPAKLDPLLVMMLVNAVYFKGDWTHPFDPKATANAPFYLLGGGSVSTPFMALEVGLDHYQTESFDAIDLPYGDGSFSMTLILPTGRYGVDDVMKLLDAESWQRMVTGMATDDGKIFLPSFELRTKLDLVKVLSGLGMAIAFQPEESDFSRIADRSDLHINEVLHETYIKVDEEGTEAAAATSIGLAVTSVQPGGFRLTFDHPFLLAIRERASGTLLFVGRITDPSAE